MVAQAEILSSPVVAEITSQKEIPEEKPLADSPYSCQWFVDTLTAKDPNFVELRRNHRVLNVNAVNISGGKGFISKVYKCEVELEGVEREYEIILKVPGMDAIESVKDNIKHDGEETKDEEEKKVAHFAAFHNKECSFYENYAAGIEGFPLVKMFDTHRWIVDETRGICSWRAWWGRRTPRVSSPDSRRVRRSRSAHTWPTSTSIF
ncbi:hypothetical protein L596_023656 [Steinernema carpocapsae]|uniref:Uncharacterized protein n=1 Tax=Steinernema carpocapsae TaxID=34508 RepID=A0A4U5MEA9_STECR|nr:hypothetical protein L596_023656 [Steinernema carpocapsae]